MNEYTINFQKLHAYKVAKEFARLVHLARISDPDLADQAKRASKSAFLQLVEGLPNASIPMRRKYFICARNSTCEVAAAIDLAIAIDCIDNADEIQRLAYELTCILQGLMR